MRTRSRDVYSRMLEFVWGLVMRSVRLSSAIICAVASVLALSLPASAASVTKIRGPVSINHGGGFIPISGGVTASPGDAVMAGPSGAAEIVYNDGCREKVDAGSVVRVAETSPCNTGSVPTNFIIGAAVVAGGVGAAIALSDDHDDHPASP